MREKRNADRILVGEPEGKRLYRKLRHRWEGNKMNLKNLGSEGVDWIYLAQDRVYWWALVNTVMNLQVL
jgi:hypothetical protein